MKILVYGRNSFMTGLASILVPHGMEVLDIRNIKDMPVSLEQYEKPDLALIEKKAEGAMSIVTYIQELWEIPVVLLVGAGIEEWQGLDKFMVDGYVNDTFSNGELFARLSAIQRRITDSGDKSS